jgi:hypothetical protein
MASPVRLEEDELGARVGEAAIRTIRIRSIAVINSIMFNKVLVLCVQKQNQHQR